MTRYETEEQSTKLWSLYTVRIIVLIYTSIHDAWIAQLDGCELGPNGY
jgi:hypothetical protein